jgi:oligopeptide transport system permease protein
MKTREDRLMEKQPIDQITDLASQLGYWQDVRRRFLKNRLAVVGFSIIGFLVLVAIVGPFVFRGNYTAAVSGEQLQRLGSKGHLLGTDDLGRDMLRRTVRGIGISFRLAFVVTLSITMIGMFMGGLAGYLGGWVDGIISRVIDAIYAIPYVIVGTALIAVFGSSFWTVMITLIATTWVGTARLFRAAVLQIRSQDYIEAARATGAGTKRIMLSHVLPNALPPIIVSVAFAIAGVILSESIYSFLGIGFIEPTPALGVMIRSARGQFQEYPHLLFVPASVLVMLTLSVVFVGDGLRDALDPKLRGAD